MLKQSPETPSRHRLRLSHDAIRKICSTLLFSITLSTTAVAARGQETPPASPPPTTDKSDITQSYLPFVSNEKEIVVTPLARIATASKNLFGSDTAVSVKVSGDGAPVEVTEAMYPNLPDEDKQVIIELGQQLDYGLKFKRAFQKMAPELGLTMEQVGEIFPDDITYIVNHYSTSVTVLYPDENGVVTSVLMQLRIGAAEDEVIHLIIPQDRPEASPDFRDVTGIFNFIINEGLSNLYDEQGLTGRMRLAEQVGGLGRLSASLAQEPIDLEGYSAFEKLAQLLTVDLVQKIPLMGEIHSGKLTDKQIEMVSTVIMALRAASSINIVDGVSQPLGGETLHTVLVNMQQLAEKGTPEERAFYAQAIEFFQNLPVSDWPNANFISQVYFDNVLFPNEPDNYAPASATLVEAQRSEAGRNKGNIIFKLSQLKYNQAMTEIQLQSKNLEVASVKAAIFIVNSVFPEGLWVPLDSSQFTYTLTDNQIEFSTAEKVPFGERTYLANEVRIQLIDAAGKPVMVRMVKFAAN